MEAEYVLDEQTALSLYDCLVPTLKEHRIKKLIWMTSSATKAKVVRMGLIARKSSHDLEEERTAKLEIR